MEILIILLVAMAGGLFGRKLKLPVGAMTGSLIAVIAYRLIFDHGYLPGQTKLLLQILSGALIGSRVKKADVLALKKTWLPAIVLTIGMIVMNIAAALIIHALSRLDFVTAYFSSAPGGLQDMALISADFSADTLVVSICQVCRVLFILIVYPWLYKLMYSRQLYPHSGSGITAVSAEAAIVTAKGNHSPVDFVKTVLAATAGGMLLRWLKVPAGALLGALLAAAILNIFSGQAWVPDPVKLVLQVLTGAYVGTQVSRDTIDSITGVLLPTAVMLAGTTILIYLLALVIRKVSRLDFMTCLLICTPGGLQEMCLLADDMDCDAPKIVLMHTVRIIIVVSLCPIVLTLMQKIFGF